MERNLRNIAIFLVCATAAIFLSACASSEQAKAPAPRLGEVLSTVDRFRLGWYDSLATREDLGWMASHGFDFVVPYVNKGVAAKIDPYLEAVKAAGLSLYMQIPMSMADKPEAGLAEFVARYKADEAVLGWYLYDEPEWKPIARPAAVKKAYDELKQLDPGRPVSLVFMFQGLARPYVGAMDEFWYDNYPVVMWTREFAAFTCGRFADRMKAAGAKAISFGKPLTLVLQGFGEDAKGKAQFTRRLPTPAETRNSFHAALLARPVSIIYWAWYRSRPEWVKSSLAPVVAEFRALFPRGVSYCSAAGLGISGCRCDATVLRNDEGRQWLLVVGRGSPACRMRLSLPAGWVFADGCASKELGFGPYESAFFEIKAGDNPVL